MDEADVGVEEADAKGVLGSLSYWGSGEADGMSFENNLSSSDTDPLAPVIGVDYADLLCVVGGGSQMRNLQAMLRSSPGIPHRSKWGIVRGEETDPDYTDTTRLYE